LVNIHSTITQYTPTERDLEGIRNCPLEMATSAFDKEEIGDELRPEASRLFSGEGNVEVWNIGKSQGKCFWVRK